METLYNSVKDFGIATAVSIFALGGCWWLVKRFMTFMNESNTERKLITERYETFMEVHIQKSSEAQNNLTQAIKDLNRDSCNEHRLIMNKLGDK